MTSSILSKDRISYECAQVWLRVSLGEVCGGRKAFLLLKEIAVEETPLLGPDLARSTCDARNSGRHLVTRRGDVVDTVRMAEGGDGELTCHCDVERSLEPPTAVTRVTEGGKGCCGDRIFAFLAQLKAPWPPGSCNRIIAQCEPGRPQGRNSFVFPPFMALSNTRLSSPVPVS